MVHTLLTLGAHAQRVLVIQYLVRKCVCLSVTTFPATTHNKQVKKRHQWVERYTGFIFKMVIFVKSAAFRRYGVKTK